jgi:hypothetical protein
MPSSVPAADASPREAAEKRSLNAECRIQNAESARFFRILHCAFAGCRRLFPQPAKRLLKNAAMPKSEVRNRAVAEARSSNLHSAQAHGRS